MNARGIEVVDLKHTLPNLQTLLLSRSPFVYALMPGRPAATDTPPARK